jgi:hypothetical protein
MSFMEGKMPFLSYRHLKFSLSTGLAIKNVLWI